MGMQKLKRDEAKRLKKNHRQKMREWKKNKYLNELRDIIIASNLLDVKPKGRRRFTEVKNL